MSGKDTITKDYMRDNATFADAFNFLIYGGRQVIQPAQLKPLDTTSIVLPYRKGQKPSPQQRYRDILKTVIAMEDSKAAYLLLGIENQSQINYAMPARNMLYDAMDYVAQIDEIARSHKMSDKMPETRAEFLSGFYKTDKLFPIITLTVYFGSDEWDAPLDLYGMLEADDEIMRFVDNYHIHLIAPANIDDGDFEKFHTELNQAMKFIKYSGDKAKLMEIVETDSAYRTISRRTADMLNMVTNSNLHYAEGKESVDMCEAIEGIRNDGIVIGEAKGRAEGSLETLIRLVRKGIISLSIASAEAGMTVEEFKTKMENDND